MEEAERLGRRRRASSERVGGGEEEEKPTVDDYFRVKIEEEKHKNRLKVGEKHVVVVRKFQRTPF